MAGSFSIDLSRFGARTKEQIDVVTRKVCLDLLSAVVVGQPVGAGTPVDTGRARGGWQVEIGKAPTGEGAPDKQGAGTIAAGSAKIGQVKGGDVVYIVNNVPYIQVLEYGRDDGSPGSPQAPDGMLRVALAAYPGIVREAANGSRRG